MKTKLKIVKIGGGIINDTTKLHSLLDQFSAIEGKKVLVHGGGKIATTISHALNQEVEIINGRRVTTEEGLKVAVMVYAGLINTEITARLARNNCSSIGLSGADLNSIESIKRSVTPVDYGFAGDVKKVNAEAINLFIKNSICPVMCSITHDGNGQLLNTNADTIAAEVAITLSEFYDVELLYCFEKGGVLYDMNDDASVISEIDHVAYNLLQKQGKVYEGMIPKLDNCFHALKNGVTAVKVGDAHTVFSSNMGTHLKQVI